MVTVSKFPSLSDFRQQLREWVHADEDDCVAALLSASDLSPQQRQAAQLSATQFIESCRAKDSKHNLLDSFLQEFSLSNHEGIALMCLAEALLRIPDKHVADQLIEEKLSSGNWRKHYGHSDSSLVNMATVGLMLTGGFVKLEDEFSGNPSSWLPSIGRKVGEPIVRQAIRQAMSIMGSQYVLGRSIDEAAQIGRKENPASTRFSFDMLGEGARTRQAAGRYFDAYMAAIQSIGKMIEGGRARDVVSADGISVKLSALHPRYHYSHHQLVMTELMPMLKQLAQAARGFNIGFTIDAEESERLDISLDLFESLVRDPELDGWDGLGLVVQAYQKRASLLIDWLSTLGRETNRRLMVRLVKGAYWDREIKFAQEMGYADYPVFTSKPNSDLSYQVCAAKLLDANDVIFPQFATHNAHTVALVCELIKARGGMDHQAFEFQRLHGMGDLLYGEVDDSDTEHSLPLRVYAPVGAHKDLLPYLVRRLLENGANSSFVNQFLDSDTRVSDIVRDPVDEVSAKKVYRHAGIPLPIDLYRASELSATQRNNSAGIDLDNPTTVEWLKTQLADHQEKVVACPVVNGEVRRRGRQQTVTSPANHAVIVGYSIDATDQDINDALDGAQNSQRAWDALGGEQRAEILFKTADLIETERAKLMAMVTAEAGRTIPDTIAEYREAADFCRYYGLQAAANFAAPHRLPGPTGESNELSLHGRGVFLCISPWNFPLAIFVGQIAAALAAGNSVIAKPAEQTPLVAFTMVQLFHQAGVPGEVLHFLTGEGSDIGPKLVNDARINGVCFTGSTQVAKLINRQLADKEGPIVPLIAETGGQNAMIVDSSALPEQVVDDVINSGFNSAGQRCSALRVLYLQKDIADDVIEMLIGALDALDLGDPADLATDIGPLIDNDARVGLEKHLAAMIDNPEAKILARFDEQRVPSEGSFFAPTVIELKHLSQLKHEVFGPFVHVIRYGAKDLDKILHDINQTGFGLTLGVHSRREQLADQVYRKTRVGNTYVNRNVVGAVVGVQPFGGQGLSGTGPKAGGPHYLYRFATEKTKTVNLVATGGDVSLLNLE